jgi:hypothetical protein
MASRSYTTLSDPHLLSALFAVFAIAVLDNPDRPTATEQAQEYYLLSWVGFYCTFPTRVATVPLVQTLVRLFHYCSLIKY